MVTGGSSQAGQPGDGTDAGGVRTGPVGEPLIVLGMHRSGTSAVAGALQLLGVELGEPLMAPRDGENTRGYFEHLEIYRFHQRLLETLGMSWDDLRSPRLEAGDPLFAELRVELAGLLRRHFAGAPLWAAKDPRACRFVPLWGAALAGLGCAPRYLVVFRHPDEVAASLGRRDRFSRDKSDLLWTDHYLAAEAATRGAQRAFLSYAELLRAPEVELTRAAAELGLEWPVGDAAAVAGELREFLSGDLRHHAAAASTPAPRGRLGTIVPRLWQALASASLDPAPSSAALDPAPSSAALDPAPSSAALDPAACESLRGELAAVQESFDPLLVEHFSQLAMRSELGRRVTELERSLDKRTEWMQIQDRELAGQHDILDERTRWLQIQDEILHRQIARIDALEAASSEKKSRGR